MKKLIRKILREEIEKSDRHYRRLDIISDYVELPYFKSMEGLTIYDEDDQEYIMRKIYGNNITIELSNIRNYILDGKGDVIYYENSNGVWSKYEYDDNGNDIYYEKSDGYWSKYEYDDNEYQIYEERSDGFWKRYEYDDRGNRVYWEDSDGNWVKKEYDDNGYRIYYEDSNGDIRDNR